MSLFVCVRVCVRLRESHLRVCSILPLRLAIMLTTIHALALGLFNAPMVASAIVYVHTPSTLTIHTTTHT